MDFLLCSLYVYGRSARDLQPLSLFPLHEPRFDGPELGY